MTDVKTLGLVYFRSILESTSIQADADFVLYANGDVIGFDYQKLLFKKSHTTKEEGRRILEDLECLCRSLRKPTIDDFSMEGAWIDFAFQHEFKWHSFSVRNSNSGPSCVTDLAVMEENIVQRGDTWFPENGRISLRRAGGRPRESIAWPFREPAPIKCKGLIDIQINTDVVNLFRMGTPITKIDNTDCEMTLILPLPEGDSIYRLRRESVGRYSLE